jgi:hypothetical protein
MRSGDPHPVQETRPPSLLFQLLGTAHSVTARLTEALAELGLSPSELDLLTRLAEAHEPLGLDDHGWELAVMLERDGLVRRVPHGATPPRVTIALTSRGAAKQRAGSERRDAAYRELARALDDLDDAAVERALSVLR